MLRPDEGVDESDRQMTVEQREDFVGVRFQVLENSLAKLAQLFLKYREETAKNYPRYEVLVDTNCLVAFTGPVENFDRKYFLQVIRETVRGRERVSKANESLVRASAEMKEKFKDKCPTVDVM